MLIIITLTASKTSHSLVSYLLLMPRSAHLISRMKPLPNTLLSQICLLDKNAHLRITNECCWSWDNVLKPWAKIATSCISSWLKPKESIGMPCMSSTNTSKQRVTSTASPEHHSKPLAPVAQPVIKLITDGFSNLRPCPRDRLYTISPIKKAT